MQKNYRTSRPEINRLFPQGHLPLTGVTLITGDARSGKTMLAQDIVREVLAAGDRVLVLCEEPHRWQRAVAHENLTVRTAYSTDDRVSHLTVVDNAQINGKVIQLAQHGPVLITAMGLMTLMALNQAAQLAMRIDRLENGMGRVMVVKSRDGAPRSVPGVESVLFKIDPNLGLVAPDYQEPTQRSAWDRMLYDEDLV